jgi:hypothetical protein
MQSQGSAKTFTLYLGGIKAERRTSEAEARNTCLDRLDVPEVSRLNLGKSADQMEKLLGLTQPGGEYCSLRSQEKGQPGRI